VQRTAHLPAAHPRTSCRLAATLGAKSTVRKLSKRDIAACDITKTCDSVKDPSEPMALRLSSQLLYGVVRIYVQQVSLPSSRSVGSAECHHRQRRGWAT
jgi:meiotic recombination protein REC8